MEYDLLNIPDDVERRRHKLKRTIPAPNSYFMGVREENSQNVAFVFSHSQTPIYSLETRNKLATPTGGKVKLSKKCQYKLNHKEQEIGGI